MIEPKIRKIVTNLEEVFYEGGAEMPVENGEKKSIKTVSVAAVIKNPYAGKWQEDLSELTEYGEYLGDLLTRKGAELLGAESVETYGKGCIVGVDGELEHSSAMLHPKAGKPIRAAIGGGKSIIPSNEKVGGVGAALDISLHYKDAAFVRTHYGSFEVCIPDAPKADEIIMAVVLVGGIKSISSFAEKVVPLMALAYVIGSIFILVKFGSNIPHVFAMIFEYAFTPMAATGGFAGSTVMLAIRWGLARGVYSNEAGTGMAPLAHSSSSANHPVKQGLWGISEVFVDTIIVCTMTALVVLCTGVWTEGGTGAALTATAFGAGFGNAIAGTVFVVAIITFFAFTTALVNVYYGEICMTVLGGKKFILPYRLLGCAFAIIGSVGALSVLWNLFDFFFGVCAVCNLVVCFLMRKQIGALINDYLTRLKSGKWEPTSEAAANAIPELWVNDKAAK